MEIEDSCPLCLKTEKMGLNAKSLYGYLVCKKCYYGFANRRQLAFFIDSLIFRFLNIPLILLISGILGLLTGLLHFSLSQQSAGLLYFFLAILLFIIKDGFGGYSPGKALLGLQVIDEESRTPIHFGQSLRRNLCLIIPFAPIIVGFTLLKGKRWGDGWAKSRVIWKKYKDCTPFTSRELGPHAPSGGFPFVAVILCGFIFLMLAAIAVPNFLRGVEMAKQQKLKQQSQMQSQNP